MVTVTVRNTTTPTTTSTRKKSTFSDTPSGGFIYNGQEFTKEGQPVKKTTQSIPSGAGVYYNLDEPEKSYVREGEGFKEVTVSQEDKIKAMSRSGGGDTIPYGETITPQTANLLQSKPREPEAGVLTITNEQAVSQKYRPLTKEAGVPLWVTTTNVPSKAVEEGSYIADIGLYSNPYGGQTAGTAEYNTANIELYRRAREGYTIDESEVSRAMNLAREKRLEGSSSTNVRLIAGEVAVYGTQLGIGYANFARNLLGTGFGNTGKFKWGDADIKSQFALDIQNTPSVPSTSGFKLSKPSTYDEFGSYLVELPNRPAQLSNIALGVTAVYQLGAGTASVYQAEKAKGLTGWALKARTADILGGEFLASFSPFGKIQSGTMGTVLSQTGWRQTTGNVDTLLGGQSFIDNKATSRFLTAGGSTWYNNKVLAVGRIETTLTGGTQPYIDTYKATDVAFVSMSGLGEASGRVGGRSSEAVSRGLKAQAGIVNEFVPSGDRYTVVPKEVTKIEVFKGSGTGVANRGLSVGAGRTYYTDLKTGELIRTSNFEFGQKDAIITSNNVKITYGRAGAVTVGTDTGIGKVGADTRLFEPTLTSSGTGTGGSTSTTTGGRTFSGRGSRGRQSLGSATKNAIQSSLGGSLSPSPPQNTPVSLPKPSLIAGRVGLLGGVTTKAGQIILDKRSMPLGTSFASPSTTLKNTPAVWTSVGVRTTNTPVIDVINTGGGTGTITNTITNIVNNIGTGIPKPTAGTPAVGLPIIPFFGGLDLDIGSSSRRIGAKNIKAYVPSYGALVYGIRGKKPKGTETGVRVRPITKGFKWSNVFRRR